ncbi:MAG: polysaccharide pyruvyl transferase family protein [Pseudomonadota bacterium]|nr:polysaccharide pyruvyl transferase family protein [Pseudomonadota bacterium]
MTKAAVVSGFWAQNIGNAFFNIGGKWILEQVFGENQVQFFQDAPAYRTFYPKHKGNPVKWANLIKDLDVEYLVLQGPMLTTTVSQIWAETLLEHRKRGVKLILLGCGLFKYTKEEISSARSFVETFKPSLVSTRDSVTYRSIKDLVPVMYDGIDSAFFAPRTFKPLSFIGQPYYVFNFDRYPEPTIKIEATDNPNDASFMHDDMAWHLQTPKLQSILSHKGKIHAYLGHLLDFRKLPIELGLRRIIRTEHRYMPHMTHKIYQHPNSVVSDEAFTYLSIYANSTLTLADRVHACVATLAYGNPAMLFTPSKRQSLFDRLGLESIRNKPTQLDPTYLKEEQDKQIEFIGNALRR